MRFRNKPVVIEAWRWAPDTERDYMPINWPEWVQDKDVKITLAGGLIIETLEGTMTASRGDWIIRGVKGEIYPCKPDIFEATYESEEAKAVA